MYCRGYYEQNKERITRQTIIYRDANREAVAERGRRYRERNKARLAELAQARYEANPTRAIERAQKWVAANPTRRKTIAQRWTELHREQIREAQRRTYRESPPRKRAYNPVQAKFANQRARARRRGAPFSATAKTYSVILSADPCAYCGLRSASIDHIHAIKHGGTSDWWNLAAACRPCNSAKGTASLLLFLRRRTAEAS